MNPLLMLLMFNPVATFTVSCAPGSQQCLFDATKSKDAVSYRWDWGNGHSEVHSVPTARNTFAPGVYCVRLTIKNLNGDSAYATKQLPIPLVAGTVLKACPRAKPVPPPVRVDTVLVFKTDTVRFVHTDTVTVYRTDTLRIYVPVPTQPDSVRSLVQPRPGEYLVYEGSRLLGRLMILDMSTGTWQAYQYILGQIDMRCLGFPTCTVFPDQASAMKALP